MEGLNVNGADSAYTDELLSNILQVLMSQHQVNGLNPSDVWNVTLLTYTQGSLANAVRGVTFACMNLVTTESAKCYVSADNINWFLVGTLTNVVPIVSYNGALPYARIERGSVGTGSKNFYINGY